MRLHYASLLVADTARSLDCYCGLLGLELEPNCHDLSFPGAWLNIGDNQIHLLGLPNPDPVAGRPDHGGRDRHTALLVNDFEQLRQQLDQAGVHYTLSLSGRQAIFCRDPDRNAVELIATST